MDKIDNKDKIKIEIEVAVANQLIKLKQVGDTYSMVIQRLIEKNG